MQLTRHADYALRILMFLGAHNNRLTSVAEISEYYSVSRHHLVKVVQGLTEHGFVTTVRGKNGGMQLMRNAENITIGEVVRKMESHFEMVECFNANTSTCVVSHSCGLNHVLQRALDRFLSELDSVSLADVINPRLITSLLEADIS